MNQSDATSPYYQYYRSNFHNPNPPPPPTPNFPSDPHTNQYTSSSFASAPPLSPHSFSNSSSSFPSYPQYASQDAPFIPNPQLPLIDQTTPYDPFYQSYNEAAAANYTQKQNPVYDPNSASYDYGNYRDQGVYGASSTEDYGGSQDGGTETGVYRYSGSNTEPYGARGTGVSKSSSRVPFDDYGRPIEKNSLPQQSIKVVKAAPKAETQQEMGSGVMKFRVRLLSESAGQTDMDILCQIGLDGIQLLDPANYRTLRIYQLDTITRWEVLDSYIFAFWAKSSVDADVKRIRLKSSSYTTNNILDAVTAASIQFKEIGSSYKSSDPAEQQSEKKKGFVDWMNIIKPKMEEKDHWVPDVAVTKCTSCSTDFGAFVRRHHCRNCGDIFCDKCTQGRVTLTADEDAQTVRVCDRCVGEVTQRLDNSKERRGSSNIGTLHSHEDLARKLKEEMEKNRRTATSEGGRGMGYGKQATKEVECPTCTVHLQVQVPASGSETIECSVCQHPFLVNASAAY
ncbi:protein FREE1-like [Impatiens glandulifera]|uniref:protein FREE1-like n=1 Tax=Impatiens glandulifera TaxID=253017 RepID=UPI001FB06AD4|nr:protein FREE1-like [Impatiens glandulifera]